MSVALASGCAEMGSLGGTKYGESGGARAFSCLWDGRDDQGQEVPEGTYRFREKIGTSIGLLIDKGGWDCCC